MDLLKKVWPISFSQEKGDKETFIKRLIIYIIGIVVVSVISFIVGLIFKDGFLSIISALTDLVTGVVDLYCTAGIVFLILRLVGVFK